jgi:hypothetical protein
MALYDGQSSAAKRLDLKEAQNFYLKNKKIYIACLSIEIHFLNRPIGQSIPLLK